MRTFSAVWMPVLLGVPVLALPESLLEKSAAWYKSDEGRKTTGRILSWQAPAGDWPKNQDNSGKSYTGERKKLKGTFDNKATTDELRYVARAFAATGDAACEKAFLAGLDHILDAQYGNGGWPQSSPPGKAYPRHITFNDGSMVRLLEFLREVTADATYRFVSDDRKTRARTAFDRGVSCILECQIVKDGKPTVWCAQHDEETLAPAAARSYELPSFSGSESAGILRFLMDIEKPSPEVVRAVKGGVEWFETHAIKGIRVEKADGDRKVVEDPKAPLIWARFYDLETGKPFFCDRDGVKKDSLSKIGKERRNGYAWYGNWGESLAKAYAGWPHR